MSNTINDSEKILRALKDLHTTMENLFILQASSSGLTGHEIRAVLGIEMARVTRITKHVKKEK